MNDLAKRAMRASSPWPQHTIRGLLFDMGDVLYDATAWRRWLHGELARRGIVQDYSSLFRVWDHEFLDVVHRGRSAYRCAFRAFLRHLGLTPMQASDVEAASQAAKPKLESKTRLFPDVKQTLEDLLQARMVLGVLSDSENSAELIERRLARLGLEHCFAAIISSSDLGCTKPDRTCYATAAAAMQLPLSEVAFVGHDADELEGARAAEMPTIAFNYEPTAKADVYLERFDELLRLLDRGADRAGFGLKASNLGSRVAA